MQSHIATKNNLDKLFANAPLRSEVKAAANHLFKMLGIHVNSDLEQESVYHRVPASTVEMAHVMAKALLGIPLNSEHADIHCTLQGHDIHIQSAPDSRISIVLDHQYEHALVFDVAFAEVVAKLQASKEWHALLLHEDMGRVDNVEQQLQSKYSAGEARKMVHYLADPENVVPWRVLELTLQQMGRQLNATTGQLTFFNDILTFPYKSPELSERVHQLQKGEKVMIPVTIKPKEIGLLCIESQGKDKPWEMTIFDGTQYSVEMVRDLYIEVVNGLKIPLADSDSLKVFQSAFKGSVGCHHDGVVHISLMMKYLMQSHMIARKAYSKYAHEVKQYELQAQQMQRLATSPDELQAAQGYTARQLRESYIRLVASV